MEVYKLDARVQATAELMVLKNMIKKFYKGPDKPLVYKTTSSKIGTACHLVNLSNLEEFRAKIEALKVVLKSGDCAKFISDVHRFRFP